MRALAALLAPVPFLAQPHLTVGQLTQESKPNPSSAPGSGIQLPTGVTSLWGGSAVWLGWGLGMVDELGMAQPIGKGCLGG